MAPTVPAARRTRKPPTLRQIRRRRARINAYRQGLFEQGLCIRCRQPSPKGTCDTCTHQHAIYMLYRRWFRRLFT